MAHTSASRTETVAALAAIGQSRVANNIAALTQGVGQSNNRRDFTFETMPIPVSSNPLYAPAPNAPFPSQGSCSNHNIETAINIMAAKGTNFKNIHQIQTFVMSTKQPCLFEGAYIFGGSGCSNEVFNGICTFHWKMMNIRIGICENYTALNDTAKNFSHYEMMVDKIIEDRSLTPFFPYINKDTTMYDVLLGFNYATVRGLQETKKNEGAAMAYALYYMINSSCRFDWMIKSQSWIDSMTTYLMACVLYNDKLVKEGLIPPEMLVNYIAEHQRPNTILHRFFQKNILLRTVNLPYNAPDSVEAMNLVLSKRDLVTRTALQRNDQPKAPEAMETENASDAATAAAQVDRQTQEQAKLVPYYRFNIFNAPIILGMRSSTFVMGRGVLANNPNVSIFNINFRNKDNTTHTARVFAMEGPIMYGVSESRPTRQLPYMNLMPRLTNSYVATLAGNTNIEPQEDRIFAGQTAKYVKYEVQTVNTANKFRLTDITDAGRYL
jgi:hypothetical protein